MAKYAKVLGSVVSMRDIRKVTIIYNNGTNYNNKFYHTLLLEYFDGKSYEYNTTNEERAREDYEGLRNALLMVTDGERRTDERKAD